MDNLQFKEEVVKLISNLSLSDKEKLYFLENGENLIKARDNLDKQESVDAFKVKIDFLSMVSHEIRTPLNGILGMTDLLYQTDLNNSQREYVETIRISGDILLNIINDILEFSKVQAGKIKLDIRTFDLRKTIDEALESLATKANEKKIDLMCYVYPDVPELITTDSVRLRQILVNLINNAIKFTEKGEVSVFVSVCFVRDGFAEFEFAIKDTGIGISEDKKKKLFSQFEQADTSTFRKYGGSGLGLFISSKLVELLGGKITVESEKNKGSTFKFRFSAKYGNLESSSLSLKTSIRKIKGKRGFIVDDSKTCRFVIKKMCEEWGLELVEFSSGVAVNSVVKSGVKFDVGIIDYNMPDQDGLAVAQELRTVYNSKDLPLILLTSLGKRIDSKVVNCDISKPLKSEVLLKILSKIFANESLEELKSQSGKDSVLTISNNYPLEILVVEDNLINQKLIYKVLEKMGYKADLASNGKEGLKSLEFKRYDLILMDIQMPEMDGYEATTQIKEKYKGNSPVIIAMTANSMKGDKEKCLEKGMDDYISKPIKIEDVKQALIYWYGKIKK